MQYGDWFVLFSVFFQVECLFVSLSACVYLINQLRNTHRPLNIVFKVFKCAKDFTYGMLK
jgi:hypothetical protein